MRSLKQVALAISGDPKKADTERFFLTVTFLGASVFLLLLSLIHFILGLALAPLVLGMVSALILAGFYFLLRFGPCLYIPKIILTLGTLLAIDLGWYTKYLSNGPVLFYFFIFSALVLWVWQGRALALWLVLYFLNLLVLFLIEATAPAALFKYPSPDVRPVDIYLSLALFSGVMLFFLFVVKKELIRQKEQARMSDKLKTAFLENMSHEVRTPMNAIIGFSQLLHADLEQDELEKYKGIIQSSGENLLRLIDDVLDLSRIQAGELEFRAVDFDLQPLFEELKEMYLLQLKLRNKEEVAIEYLLPQTCPSIIHADPERLRQVLGNLLNNAVKFTRKGSILLSCERRADDWLFTVSDTGTGIPKDDQHRVFDRFIKHNYQEMNANGTGIGLSIARRIVETMDGCIWLKSEPGTGSHFYFNLPAKKVR